MPSAPPPVTRTITLAEGMTGRISPTSSIRVKDVLAKLLMKRLMLTINSTLDTDTAMMIAREFGADVQMRSFEEELLLVDADEARVEDVVMARAGGHRHGSRRPPAKDQPAGRDPRERASRSGKPAASRSTSARITSRINGRTSSSSTRRATKRSR